MKHVQGEERLSAGTESCSAEEPEVLEEIEGEDLAVDGLCGVY